MWMLIGISTISRLSDRFEETGSRTVERYTTIRLLSHRIAFSADDQTAQRWLGTLSRTDSWLKQHSYCCTGTPCNRSKWRMITWRPQFCMMSGQKVCISDSIIRSLGEVRPILWCLLSCIPVGPFWMLYGVGSCSAMRTNDNDPNYIAPCLQFFNDSSLIFPRRDKGKPSCSEYWWGLDPRIEGYVVNIVDSLYIMLIKFH